jgi:formylglycine-generating enzyme required for sulfatase activity
MMFARLRACRAPISGALTVLALAGLSVTAADPDLIRLEVAGDVEVAGRPGAGPVYPLPRTVAVDPLSGMAMAFIENPGNPDDRSSALGGVSYLFRIAIHEVTNTQYVEFLNAVAASDPNGLYAPIMSTSDRGGILRDGSPGSYTYGVKPNFGNKPANGFTWYDAARFCNWLHNGKISGPQGPLTTEDGAYDLSLPGDQIVRKPARYFIPTHDEWYKAAYYDPVDPLADASGTQDYWLYPTRSDLEPLKAMADLVGNVTNPGLNVANMDKGADWNDENGNVTTVGGSTSQSPWGLLDMAGNINEQTETLGTPIPPNPPDQPDALPTRRIRGGDFANQILLAASPAFLSGSLNMEAEAANIGFRVAARYCSAGPIRANPARGTCIASRLRIPPAGVGPTLRA